MGGNLYIQISSTLSPMCSLGASRPCCGHSVAHLLHAGIQSHFACCNEKQGWHSATHTAHLGEPESPLCTDQLGLRFLCDKKTKVWR